MVSVALPVRRINAAKVQTTFMAHVIVSTDEIEPKTDTHPSYSSRMFAF